MFLSIFICYRLRYQTFKSDYDWFCQQQIIIIIMIIIGIWYSSTKLDNNLHQNVQNISWSQKVYRENRENPVSGIDRRREKLCWSEGPKRYIPRICTITITIYNCDYVIQSYTLKRHSRIQTYRITGKDKSLNVHERHQIVCKKKKKRMVGNSNTRPENIQ